MIHTPHTHTQRKMQGTRSECSVFSVRNFVSFAFFVMIAYTRGESSSSESEPLFNFLRTIDPKNVLNITNFGSPCNLVKLNIGVIRCNKNHTNVVEIRLDNLNLSGAIDADSLCRLRDLRVVSLAKNNIRGTIPHSILHCTRLVYLNLTGNQLSGRLPYKSLAKLKYLQNLDISNNNFYGMIPIRRLLTYNNFVTSIKLESSNSYGTDDWRKGLIGDNTNSISPISNPLSETLSDNAKKSNGSSLYSSLAKTWLPVILGVGVLVLSLYFAAKKFPKFSEERKASKVSPAAKKANNKSEAREEAKPKKAGDSSGLVFFIEEHERFSLEDLLRATVDDLRSESFSSRLYKVKLKNNVHYAVKRLKNVQVSSNEFGETLRQISKLKHPNILPLVGYRSTSDEKLIIYKYQSNGSLLNLLNDYIAGRKHFPWKLRLSIACGVARGLACIYKKVDGQEEAIIPHGNLKLSNILLNEDNEPLISEHGLSKFLDPNRGFLLSSQGYSAPERSLTEKGDVYSFGVILLELLTGKSIEISRIDLARWVRSMVREEWTAEVFDKEVEETEHKWAFPVLNIAIMCVSRFQENRPTMVEILERIEEVMEELEEQELVFSTCCSNGSKDCCPLHKIIPDEWDSPGSNY